MAILFESWKHDGKGQSLVQSLRSDARGYSPTIRDNWLSAQAQDPSVVLITKNRTDKHSKVEHVLYTKPGYVDPCL